MDTKELGVKNSELIDKLDQLESRIAIIEEQLSIKLPPYLSGESNTQDETENEEDNGQGLLESKIGEYGLAWIGNIVLLFGIIFLEQYIRRIGGHMISAIFGYLSAVSILVIGIYLHKSLPKMASLFKLNSYIIFYFITLRLHFYDSEPLVANLAIEILLLLVIPVIIQVLSIRSEKPYLSGVAMIFLAVSAIISGYDFILLTISGGVAALSLFTLIRFRWIRLLYFAMILSYFLILTFLLNNPFIANEARSVQNTTFGIISLFFIGIVYSIPVLMNLNNPVSRGDTIGLNVLNGFGFSLTLLLFVLDYYITDYSLLLLVICIYCLLYSVLLQIKSNWKISASLYALYGFITLSIAVYGYYSFPMAYFMLAFQSLLVVIMAIWFKSKFIVVMNSLLFLTLLILYLISSEMIDGVNVSFSLTALATARILNWKKDRLTIKTDLLRNFYLLTGAVMVLVTLYFMVPIRYIALSWSTVAVLYFVLSLLLNNVKYRYLAIGTLISAAFYLFIIDLARIELAYRVIALLFFALISIGLSIYYSKRSKKKSSTTEE